MSPYYLPQSFNLILNGQSDDETQGQTSALDKVETPRRFKVVLLNDDFTPMDFVIFVLERFFGRSATEAERIMMDVHHKGAGVAGVYSQEVAEMKTTQVNTYARQNKHPLKCTMEAE